MKSYQKLLVSLFFIVSLHITLYTLHSQAAVPHLINYQGRLTDSSGQPLNGAYNLTFRIYDAETGGNLLWQGTYNGVTIEKGIFSVLLGGVSDAGYDFSSLAFDKPYWLEIKVGAEVMSPRQRITSTGYAIRTEKAKQADIASQLSISAQKGDILYYDGSQWTPLGVGTSGQF